ncbi:hypothetical protein SAMN05421741_11625 [Paenimyroides ummariense]|uniref:Uncharacterized protein n=1 Tax=Paenimyroides ummariense TaxID=913024 RepID=A0A1I5DJN9_9FLAO|nr:hypothetical protein [Paenimyroides ummariense]SFN99423.1 hypothetical protein SAMN05421741_11625 [Paenimyroides ummariense]
MNIKISKITASILLSVLFNTAFCQDKIDFSKCKPTMPNPRHFCGEVGAKGSYKGADGSFDYSYQKIMYDSACADLDNMPEKEVNQKLRDWWDLYKDKLTCDNVQFNVPNGSVFKFAIRANLTAFIDDAIYAKFDLNYVDKADGRTVLDYTKDELNKQTTSSPIRKVLQEYYDRLRAAGAKHKSEL